MRKLLLLAAALGLTLFWACRLSPTDSQDYFDIIGDSTWTSCDSVLVVLVGKDGTTFDTLFNDVLVDVSQLKNLSAAKYDGTKAALVITGKKGGGLCFEEKRSFQGDGQSVVIDTIKSTTAPVQGVAVDPDTLSIPLGGSAVAVKASIKPTYADQSVFWSLAGDGVVSLGIPSDGDGTQVKVNPEKIGETILTVRSRKDSSKSAELHIKVTAPSGIEVGLDRDSVVVYVGGGMDSVKATVLPASANQKVEWKSLNPGVATIDSLGRIKPVAVGETYVQAKSVANGVYASAHVAVLRDVPKLTVASKTGAPVNTDITFSPKAVQAYGSIVMYKWDLDGNGDWDDSLANPGAGLVLDLPPQTT
ncbi:MAG: ancA 3, partial [Verrucomicrobiales bacterium]|nr:ancA 3 [Verrucomicrobiales bacterium]